MFQLVLSTLINFFLPQSKFRLLVVINDLQDVLVQFFNVLVLFSLSNSLAEAVNLLERL